MHQVTRCPILERISTEEGRRHNAFDRAGNQNKGLDTLNYFVMSQKRPSYLCYFTNINLREVMKKGKKNECTMQEEIPDAMQNN